MELTRGLTNEWFRSYLTNREQFISVNNFDSDPLQITCGASQGSVLGRVLFLIYIADFTNCSSVFDFLLFADDSNLFYDAKRFRNGLFYEFCRLKALMTLIMLKQGRMFMSRTSMMR